jgi:hypothetical protein
MSENSQSRPQLCCEASLEAGEPLMATASLTHVWLLLEHTAAWGAKALPESNLPESVKTFFNHQLETIPNSRFQFIKQSARLDVNPRFYVACSRSDKSVTHEFHLSLDELTQLDIVSVVAGAPEYDAAIYTAPLFLVCTNGRRDLACARYGLPLYQAMSSFAGQSVWQTTHIGGHRFAGTIVCLPEGLYYGRVNPDDVENLVTEHRAGRIYLDHYRGHSIYDSPEQAAEHFLRQHTGMFDIRGLIFTGTESFGENRWLVTFTVKDEEHRLQISSGLSDFEIYESTGKPEKSRVTIYHLEEYATRTTNPAAPD